MTRTVKACPECDTTQINRRSRDVWEHSYLCQQCGEEFDDPTVREPNIGASVVATTGLARELERIGRQRDE